MSPGFSLRLLAGAALLPLALIEASTAHAQDINPGVLNPGVLQREFLPPTPNLPELSPTRPDPEVITPSESKPKAADSQLKVVITEVIFSGNTAISSSELQSLATPILNKQVSYDEIESFVNNVTSYYRSKGYFTSVAVLPKQDISKGILTVQIVEGFIERIEIQRQPQRSGATTSPQVSEEPGGPLETWLKGYLSPVLGTQKQPLTISRLERQLILAEAVGGIDIASVLSPGTSLGASILTLRISPNKSQIGLGIDNWVPKQLGSVRGTVSFFDTPVIGIPIGTATSGSYTWPVANGLTSAYFSGSVPLSTSGLTSSVSFSYTGTNSSPISSGLSGVTLTTSGQSFYGSLAYRYPIQLSRQSSLYTSMQIDLLNSNNTTYSSSIPLYGSTANLRTLRFRLDYANASPYSSLQAGLQLSQGLSGMGAQNSLDISGLSSDNNYGNLDFSTAQLNLSYQTSLGRPSPVQLSLRAAGQLAVGPTPSAEQIGYGGMTYGRGLRSFAFLGDQGLLGSIEISYSSPTPSIGLLLQPYLFLDGGATSFKQSALQNSSSASTTGLGLRIYSTKSSVLSADAGWGVPIASNSAAVLTGTSNSFGFFKVNLNF